MVKPLDEFVRIVRKHQPIAPQYAVWLATDGGMARSAAYLAMADALRLERVQRNSGNDLVTAGRQGDGGRDGRS